MNKSPVDYPDYYVWITTSGGDNFNTNWINIPLEAFARDMGDIGYFPNYVGSYLNNMMTTAAELSLYELKLKTTIAIPTKANSGLQEDDRWQIVIEFPIVQ